jgi:tripartite-type tricarboxylate transporter receptor subunit TctC
LFEAGIRGVEADTLFGLWAPAATPQDVVARLNREVNKSLALPAVKERFAVVGGDTEPGSVADFKQKIQIESALFGAVIRSRNIKAD